MKRKVKYYLVGIVLATLVVSTLIQKLESIGMGHFQMFAEIPPSMSVISELE